MMMYEYIPKGALEAAKLTKHFNRLQDLIAETDIMTPVCTCKQPIIVNSTTGGEAHCDRCGYWWIPKYGSVDPQTIKERVYIESITPLKASRPKKPQHWLLKRNKLGG